MEELRNRINMILARVIGTGRFKQPKPGMIGRKLLIVKPWRAYQKPAGKPFIA